PSGPSSSDLSEYCALASRDGLAWWVGDVMTVCTDAPVAGDHEAPAACVAFRAQGADAALIELPAEVQARLVMPASEGRLVVLTVTDRLLVGAAAGLLHEISGWAAEPRVSDDGQRVVYVALAD